MHSSNRGNLFTGTNIHEVVTVLRSQHPSQNLCGMPRFPPESRRDLPVKPHDSVRSLRSTRNYSADAPSLAHCQEVILRVCGTNLSPRNCLVHHDGGRDSSWVGCVLSKDSAIACAESTTPIGPSSSLSAIICCRKQLGMKVRFGLNF